METEWPVLIYGIELATHAEKFEIRPLPQTIHTQYFRQIKSLNNKKQIPKNSKECTEVNFR